MDLGQTRESNAGQNLKIGIVIPIYNVAPYLRQCLDSVLNQTYGNFYAVLVNDGSTDYINDSSLRMGEANEAVHESKIDFHDFLRKSRNDNNIKGKAQISESLQIALEYVAKDSRFILFDKANGGLSSARNVGIAWFNGELQGKPTQMTCYANPDNTNLMNLTPPKIDYIIFLDSDDYWESNLLESCVDSAQKHKADIVWFGWNTIYENVGEQGYATRERESNGDFTWLKKYNYTTQAIISNIDFLTTSYGRNINMVACAWDKCINFSFLQRVNGRFLDGVLWEDVVFAELLFAQSERIAILPKALTNYRIRLDNISNFARCKQKNLPPFVKPLQKHFKDANEAWAYFSAYSWVVLAQEFVRFCDNYGDNGICERLKECFLGHLLGESSAIIGFQGDPYNAQNIFAGLVQRFGKQYLPKNKRYVAYYDKPILWCICKFWHNFYEWLKGLERKFRRWRKNRR